MSEAWSKQHGRSDEGGPGCVPGSEKMILCVDVRDLGCVQLIAGEGGSRTSKEVSFDFLWRRGRFETRKKRDEIERIYGKTDASMEKRSWK